MSVYTPSSMPGGTGYTRKGDISVNDAVNRIRTELGRMAVSDNDLVISTNLVLRLDGLPRSDQKRPQDPGAAVYWVDAFNNRRCMAIDQCHCNDASEFRSITVKKWWCVSAAFTAAAHLTH